MSRDCSLFALAAVIPLELWEVHAAPAVAWFVCVEAFPGFNPNANHRLHPTPANPSPAVVTPWAQPSSLPRIRLQPVAIAALGVRLRVVHAGPARLLLLRREKTTCGGNAAIVIPWGNG